MGLFNKLFGRKQNEQEVLSVAFEKQVRRDGIPHAAKRIAELVNEKIDDEGLARQFVLEELDAARHGDELAVSFVTTCGIAPSEYIGAMKKTSWEGEESKLEHIQLLVRTFGFNIKDSSLRSRLGIAVLDEIMEIWKLGKYASNKDNALARPPEQFPKEKKPDATAKEYTNNMGIRFTLIPAGTFRRDDGPNVTISKPFYLGVYPVTQEQWEAVMGSTPSAFKGRNCPVSNVSWDDAQAFIKRLNAKEKQGCYRLPTEMEWELAARAGTDTKYFFGDSKSRLDDYAWFDKNSGKAMHPVGQKKANPYGLFDIYGNVWEWVQDFYEDLPKGALYDYCGPSCGTEHVIRGGCWFHSAKDCQSGERDGLAAFRKSDFLGFRLALSIEQNGEPPKAMKYSKAKSPQSALVQVLTEFMELQQDEELLEVLRLSATGLPLSALDHDKVDKIYNLMHRLTELTGQSFEELFVNGGLEKIIAQIDEYEVPF